VIGGATIKPPGTSRDPAAGVPSSLMTTVYGDAIFNADVFDPWEKRFTLRIVSGGAREGKTSAAWMTPKTCSSHSHAGR